MKSYQIRLPRFIEESVTGAKVYFADGSVKVYPFGGQDAYEALCELQDVAENGKQTEVSSVYKIAATGDGFERDVWFRLKEVSRDEIVHYLDAIGLSEDNYMMHRWDVSCLKIYSDAKLPADRFSSTRYVKEHDLFEGTLNRKDILNPAITKSLFG